MRQFRYVTNRILVNRAGQEKGKIRVMVKEGSSQAEGDYQCPECSHQGKISQAFKRPLAVRCGGCDFMIKLPKLKKK